MANGIVEGLHRGTVNVVRPVVPANLGQDRRAQGQGVQPAAVVADAVVAVAEVVVVAVDVDLK